MAEVDFVWQPDTAVGTGPNAYQYAAFNEGTGVSSFIPLTFTISQVQAVDTVVTFGIHEVYRSTGNAHFPGTREPFPTIGDIAEQYDLSDSLTVVIPAGQLSVTVQWAISADNQDESDGYPDKGGEAFDLYIKSVSGGHTIEAADRLENQLLETHVTGTEYSTYGFNMFVIKDDDVPNYVNVWSSHNDAFTIAEGNALPIYAGAGDDSITGSSGADTVLAHDGNDIVDARGGSDVLHMGAGNDWAFGGAGNDIIFGGLDSDVLYGDDGDDVIWGNGPTDDGFADEIHGGTGNDTLLGQGGDDVIFGDDGSDAIAGGIGVDTLHGGDGNDIIFGGAGGDLIFGEAGDDVLWGEDNTGSTPGNDAIDGGGGNDTILGQGGNDVLFGEGGNDAIAGGDGSDYLLGGSGADILQGGAGADLFGFSIGDGVDTIMDFNAGGVHDGIDLRAYFDAIGYAGTAPRAAGLLAVYQNGANTEIYVQGAHIATLLNVVAAALDDSYFLFQ